MASVTSEDASRYRPDCLVSADSGPYAQAAWTTGSFGIKDPAPPDVFAYYFESQPVGSAGELCPLGIYTLSNTTTATSPMSDCLPSVADEANAQWSQGFDFQGQHGPYTTPDFDIAAWESGLPFGDLTPHQPSSAPSQDSPSKSRGSSTHAPGSTAQHVEEPHERLRKNREAARRCRRSKKKSNADLEAKELQLRNSNINLNAQVAELRNEVLNLKSEILKHAGCDFEHISNYLDREAAKIR